MKHRVIEAETKAGSKFTLDIDWEGICVAIVKIALVVVIWELLT